MKINNLTTYKATGKIDDQFVGIKIANNQVEFYYPETYQLSDDEDGVRRDILAILRTVALAKTQTSDQSSYNTQHSNADSFPVAAYLWIINDYLVYGRYENREKTYERGTSGKINWKKTINSNPVISRGNIIYTDIVSERKSQKDNLLTEIYYFCVQKSYDSIGWLYGLSYNPNGIDYYKLFNAKKYLGAINSELLHTFDDQKKIRLLNMKNIILGLDDNMVSSREIIYGVDSYDYVYERMIDAMFSRVDNIKEFYPTATWNLVLDNKVCESSKLRPDTVFEYIDKKTGKKEVFIIDAKYYRYGTTFAPGDMPETTSIQKQITYGEYVKAAKRDKGYTGVYSAFLLPYSKDSNIHNDLFYDNLVFAGTGKAKWFMDDENPEKKTNREIAAILIDTKFLINNWVRRSEAYIDRLALLIEEKVKDGGGQL